MMVQGAAHAVAQGVLSLVQGQDFVSAFTSGLLGSYGASAFSAIAVRFASSVVGTIASGAILGGVGSELAGGNFWQGAAIGGFVAGFNHVTHRMGDDPTKKRQQIVKNTRKQNGSTDWAYDRRNGRYGSETNKCNIFVDDMLDASGIYTSDPNGRAAAFGLGSPVTAGQWADPNYNIPGWKIVNSPQAGDMVAIKGNFSDASGHVAIMVSPTESIGAGHNKVHVTDFGYNPKHFSDFPGNNGYVYRRYIGFPSAKPVQINTNNYYRQYP